MIICVNPIWLRAPLWPFGLASSLTKHILRSTLRNHPHPSKVSPGSAVRSCQAYSTRVTKSGANRIPQFAFAFDIDGVLIRSSSTLPGASNALKFLHENGIPFILLTNGGGKHEVERVKELSKKFDVPLSVENFIQSHTPFQEMAQGSENYAALKDKTIFVTGGDQEKIRNIAEQYGFKNVVTPADIVTAHPEIWPFNQIWTSYYENIGRPLPQPIDPGNQKSLKIDSIFVFNDPRDWGLDTQIIIDLLLSHDGILGSYSSKNGDNSLPNNGWQQDGQPTLTFSNPDLFWAAAYHLPRFGQGAFRASLEGVWKDVTSGATLTHTVIGKPYRKTYLFAERVLQKHRADLLAKTFEREKIGKLKRVFMVGDNPESDIRGANEFQSPNDTEWSSLLVKTGVWKEGTVPKYTPTAIVPDVLGAVRWALKEEGFEFRSEDLEV